MNEKSQDGETQKRQEEKAQKRVDRLHRQARVKEEIKHHLKVHYKRRNISKNEYKSILRRAVSRVTDSRSAIDPEKIRSLVKKYVEKLKKRRVRSFIDNFAIIA